MKGSLSILEIRCQKTWARFSLHVSFELSDRFERSANSLICQFASRSSLFSFRSENQGSLITLERSLNLKERCAQLWIFLYIKLLAVLFLLLIIFSLSTVQSQSVLRLVDIDVNVSVYWFLVILTSYVWDLFSVYGLQLEPIKLLSLSVIVNFSNTAVLLKFELVYLSGKQNLFRAD